jgi:PAS domain S-box-containing protein
MESIMQQREADIMRAVIDHLAIGVVVADMGGRFLVFNPAAERMVGIGARNLNPVEWTAAYGCFLPDRVTLYPPDRLPLVRALRGETTVDETMFVSNSEKPAGTWLSISGRPLRTGDGTLWGGMVFLRDITAEKDAEESLRSTTSRLAVLLDNQENAILIENEDRRVSRVNRAFCDLFGLVAHPADLLGADCLDLAGEISSLCLDPQGFNTRVEQLLSDKSILTNERVHLADGRVLERDYIPVFIEREYRGHVWQYRDISVRDQARQQIKIFERLATAVEQTADSVVITNEKGIIEYVNPAFEETTGYRRHEVLGKTPGILKSGEHDAEFYRQLWSEILAGRPFRGTITNRKKTGELYRVQQTITPIKSQEGAITHFVSVLKDITELLKMKEQEANLRLAREVQQRFYRATAAVPGYDIAGAAFPADETGGDYYDFIPLPDGCLCIAIGDVSGHGVGAALVMAETRAYVRAFAASGSPVDEIMTRLNAALAQDLHNGRFVTLLLCCLDPRTRTVTYASAGHDPGYLLHPSADFACILGATGPPLGLLPKTRYTLGRVDLMDSGQFLVLMTDGITDAASPDGTVFDQARAIDYVRKHRHDSAAAIATGLCDASKAFIGDQRLQDDMATVILKVR